MSVYSRKPSKVAREIRMKQQIKQIDTKLKDKQLQGIDWNMIDASHQQIVDLAKEFGRTVALEVKGFISNPENLKTLGKDEDAELGRNIYALQKDVTAFIDRVNTTHDLHKDKTGPIKDADELILAMQVNAEYEEASRLYLPLMQGSNNEIIRLTGLNAMVAEQLSQNAAEVTTPMATEVTQTPVAETTAAPAEQVKTEEVKA